MNTNSFQPIVPIPPMPPLPFLAALKAAAASQPPASPPIDHNILPFIRKRASR